MLTLLPGGKDRITPALREAKPKEAAIADRLHFAREQVGLSLGQVNRLTGIPRRVLDRLESGHIEAITSPELIKLCSLYEMSANWALGRYPEQADLSRLEPKVRAYIEALPESNRHRLLTILAMEPEVSLGR